MMQKKWVLLGLLLSLHYLGNTQQSLTGTWLACYQQELPGKRQLFMYRFFLKQTENQLWGLGQAINADVSLAQLSQVNKQPQAAFRLFGLLEGNISSFRLQATPFTTLEDMPSFVEFECTPTSVPFAELVVRAPAMTAIPNPNGFFLAKVDLIKLTDSLPPAFLQTLKDEEPIVFEDEPMKARQRKSKRLATDTGTLQQTLLKVEEVQAHITLPEDLLWLSVYDNGTIDNDTVSIMLNGSEIISRERLTQHPVKRVIHLDKRRENKLVLVAHNEGTVPPNTALLILESGSVRKQVHLGSTLLKNGVMVIKVQKEAGAMPTPVKVANH